jgi:hypothetical protein
MVSDGVVFFEEGAVERGVEHFWCVVATLIRGFVMDAVLGTQSGARR